MVWNQGKIRGAKNQTAMRYCPFVRSSRRPLERLLYRSVLEVKMVDTALVGRAKELEVAGVLIRNGIFVFWPLVDKGTDLLATNRDCSICIPVQVRYS